MDTDITKLKAVNEKVEKNKEVKNLVKGDSTIIGASFIEKVEDVFNVYEVVVMRKQFTLEQLIGRQEELKNEMGSIDAIINHDKEAK